MGNGILAGKKTYVAAFLGALGFIAAYLTGDATAVEAGQGILTAILGATIRNGVAKS